MSSSPVIGVFLALTGVVASTSADANWSGTNSYFIYSIPNPDRGTMLDAIAGAGYKVIRVFITSTGARSKGTNSTGVHDLEPGTVGVYYDSILTQIDQLMVDCIQRRLKLIIAMHDRYMLGWSGSDAYVYKYHLPTGSHNNATAFYFDSRAQSDFDRRLLHILNHQNALLGNRSWSALSEAVFAFEPENESQGYLSVPNPSWLCDRAAVIRQALGPGNPILVSTGGGVAFSDSNSKSYFQCPSIDIVAVHDYTRQTASGLNQSLALARQYGKRIILEEFGATGTNKATSLGTQSSAAMSLGIPWIVWESLNPGAGAADYEFWTNEPGWQTLSTNAIKSLTLNSSFTWPELYSGHASTTPANRRVQPTTARQKRTTTKVHRMTTKVQKMTTKVHRMTTKVHRMTTKVQMMTTKVHRMTTKVHRMTTKVQKMTTKAQRMTSKVHRMTTKRMTTKVHRMTTKVQRMTTPEDNLRGKLMTTTVQNRNVNVEERQPTPSGILADSIFVDVSSPAQHFPSTKTAARDD
ncbi:hypothetical protein PBRA_005926 [Plasmodiophora brassicae]|uniref:Glycoside hydrolase family 5 domain-containing protein n=1 Tax=Plasmodiophora brassicae TaxID=37360 RepID=A0A0G4IRJ3_PLABS|nr:hypothetical protein PBRA_005926 [Plasmodiophora brassicae]